MTTLPVLDTARLTGYLAEIAKLTALIPTIIAGGPAGYATAAVELATMWNEIAAMTNAGTLTAQDIADAHAANQHVWPTAPAGGTVPPALPTA